MRISDTSLKLEDLPLQYDEWFSFAMELEQTGKWDIAARIFRHLASMFGNGPCMNVHEANALYHFGDYRSALQVIDRMIRPTVSSLLIEGRCYSKMGEPEHAISCYQKAERILG